MPRKTKLMQIIDKTKERTKYLILVEEKEWKSEWIRDKEKILFITKKLWKIGKRTKLYCITIKNNRFTRTFFQIKHHDKKMIGQRRR